MKKLFSLLLFLAVSYYISAQENQTAKSCFYQAKTELENMLTGKTKPDFEEAIFLIENAWYENRVNRKEFTKAIDANVKTIEDIISTNNNLASMKQKPNYLLTQKQIEERYKKALTNWAIYTFITENVYCINNNDDPYIHYKFNYSRTDPMATGNWANTQIIHLNNTKSGNCFALASMFKILSDRLKTEASLCTAPSHIYIRHADEKGTKYNVELGTQNFPGTGTISTITYSTDEAVQNNISQRELTTHQEIALCLVYLAKGFEHKFNISNDSFMLECAETALKYDPRNLNALLLKVEYLENKMIATKKTLPALQSNKDFQTYQDLIINLYELGYREMPLEMKNQIIRSYIKDEQQPKYTLANPITSKGKYATLSWGIFDERHEKKPIEQIGNTRFSTKTKKITAFVSNRKLYNGYDFDPIVFAWNIDPLFQMYPSISPYAFVANSPIRYIDPDGQKITVPNVDQRNTVIQLINEKSFHQYKFNEEGVLVRDETAKNNPNGSKYYSSRIEEAIPVKDEIRIEINQKFELFKDEFLDVDKEFGGGVTRDKWQEDRQEVTVTGHSNENIKDKSGKKLKHDAGHVLLHELLGHAIPKLLKKKDTGDAIKNENKARKELPGGKERGPDTDDDGKPVKHDE